MPIVMKMKWDGVTPDQYDQATKTVNWVDDAPAGGMFHVSWFENGALNVIDVWDSAEQFQAFTNDRLMPGVQKLGIQGAPEVDIQPTHAVLDQVHKERW